MIADPEDADNDGISGRISFTENMQLGRFGWRANIHSLAGFVEDALQTELGLNPADSNTAELYAELTHKLTVYLTGLGAPPTARSVETPEVFRTAGCSDCHREDLPIDDSVQPLTDLLLHDIGSGHFEMGDARNDYRTAPLWGLRDSGPYLHDGRSMTIEAAILAHDGEAASSRSAYEMLGADQKSVLQEFLLER